VAAKMTGRTYIGVDLSEEYCEIAQNRLDETEAWIAPVVEV
jgi:DNA modification methylase